ncbi:protein tyrosine kinase domain-containing protein [Ditylenchus destructor]|uniref:mitogen-activated protein kinase kinase kinase n=1 Tax=Ditylenchus destructor TaxID=166010 RepID=A0AAD4R115_9BILA|nr:protein tyrosine kinase domain-containing protein [Ditylenchus destructor]
MAKSVTPAGDAINMPCSSEAGPSSACRESFPYVNMREVDATPDEQPQNENSASTPNKSRNPADDYIFLDADQIRQQNSALAGDDSDFEGASIVSEIRFRDPKRQVGTAYFDYQAREHDELSLKRGSVVEIIKKDCDEDGWIEAKIDNKRGMVPKNYIGLIGSQPNLIEFSQIQNSTKIIGTGGSSDVYLGTFRNQQIALKIPKKKQGMDVMKIREALEREALFLSRLKHDHIVGFIGMSLHPMLLVLELCEGGTLFNLCRRMSSSDALTVVTWAKQVASAMEHLHNREDPLVHADLKADNVLIKEIPCECGLNSDNWKDPSNYPEEDGPMQYVCRECGGRPLKFLTLKLTDFGLSRSVNTKRGSICGSWSWMPPEVIEKNQYSKQSDVWSFGVFLWEVLSCKIPFTNYDAHVIMIAIVERKKTLPLPENCPEELQAVFGGCWKRRAAERHSFSTIIKLLEEAEQVIDIKYKWNVTDENQKHDKTHQTLSEIAREIEEGKIKLDHWITQWNALAKGVTLPPPAPVTRRKGKKGKLDKHSIGAPLDFRHNVEIKEVKGSPDGSSQTDPDSKRFVINLKYPEPSVPEDPEPSSERIPTTPRHSETPSDPRFQRNSRNPIPSPEVNLQRAKNQNPKGGYTPTPHSSQFGLNRLYLESQSNGFLTPGSSTSGLSTLPRIPKNCQHLLQRPRNCQNVPKTEVHQKSAWNCRPCCASQYLGANLGSRFGALVRKNSKSNPELANIGVRRSNIDPTISRLCNHLTTKISPSEISESARQHSPNWHHSNSYINQTITMREDGQAPRNSTHIGRKSPKTETSGPKISRDHSYVALSADDDPDNFHQRYRNRRTRGSLDHTSTEEATDQESSSPPLTTRTLGRTNAFRRKQIDSLKSPNQILRGPPTPTSSYDSSVSAEALARPQIFNEDVNANYRTKEKPKSNSPPKISVCSTNSEDEGNSSIGSRTNNGSLERCTKEAAKNHSPGFGMVNHQGSGSFSGTNSSIASANCAENGKSPNIMLAGNGKEPGQSVPAQDCISERTVEIPTSMLTPTPKTPSHHFGSSICGRPSFDAGTSGSRSRKSSANANSIFYVHEYERSDSCTSELSAQDSETSMPRRRSGSSKRLQNLLMSPFKKLGSGGNRHSNTSHASKVCNCSAYGDPGQCICIDNAERTIVERAVCYHPHHHHNSVDEYPCLRSYGGRELRRAVEMPPIPFIIHPDRTGARDIVHVPISHGLRNFRFVKHADNPEKQRQRHRTESATASVAFTTTNGQNMCPFSFYTPSDSTPSSTGPGPIFRTSPGESRRHNSTSSGISLSTASKNSPSGAHLSITTVIEMQSPTRSQAHTPRISEQPVFPHDSNLVSGRAPGLTQSYTDLQRQFESTDTPSDTASSTLYPPYDILHQRSKSNDQPSDSGSGSTSSSVQAVSVRTLADKLAEKIPDGPVRNMSYVPMSNSVYQHKEKGEERKMQRPLPKVDKTRVPPLPIRKPPAIPTANTPNSTARQKAASEGKPTPMPRNAATNVTASSRNKKEISLPKSTAPIPNQSDAQKPNASGSKPETGGIKRPTTLNLSLKGPKMPQPVLVGTGFIGRSQSSYSTSSGRGLDSGLCTAESNGAKNAVHQQMAHSQSQQNCRHMSQSEMSSPDSHSSSISSHGGTAGAHAMDPTQRNTTATNSSDTASSPSPSSPVVASPYVLLCDNDPNPVLERVPENHLYTKVRKPKEKLPPAALSQPISIQPERSKIAKDLPLPRSVAPKPPIQKRPVPDPPSRFNMEKTRVPQLHPKLPRSQNYANGSGNRPQVPSHTKKSQNYENPQSQTPTDPM